MDLHGWTPAAWAAFVRTFRHYDYLLLSNGGPRALDTNEGVPAGAGGQNDRSETPGGGEEEGRGGERGISDA